MFGVGLYPVHFIVFNSLYLLNKFTFGSITFFIFISLTFTKVGWLMIKIELDFM